MAHGRHGEIVEYNKRVQARGASSEIASADVNACMHSRSQAEAEGHFETCATVGNVHEVNPRDRVVVGYLIDRLMANGRLAAADFAAMPFNALRRWGP